MALASPCVGLCRIESSSGLCLGCTRTGAEIAAWSSAEEANRSAVWSALPRRREQLGIGAHRLPWGPGDVAASIRQTLAPGGGTWVSGLNGAVAEFSIGVADWPSCHVSDGAIDAVAESGAIHFTLPPDIRAFRFGADGPADATVLAIASPRARDAAATGLQPVGLDAEALVERGRAETLFDLGLGRASASFCIRTGRADLLDLLHPLVGQPWPALLAAAGAALLEQSPTRVVRHALGRLEVFSPIPPPGSVSPAGPHTHLLPALLRRGGDLPPGFLIPVGFLPCAAHFRTPPLRHG